MREITVAELLKCLEMVPPELREHSTVAMEIIGGVRKDGGRSVYRLPLGKLIYKREETCLFLCQ